ncbi:MAG: hypothetical protein Cons2KO_10210 [Congregibacter sp.]
MSRSYTYPVPQRRMGLTIEQLREAAQQTVESGLLIRDDRDVSESLCDVVALSHDLLLARSSFDRVPEDVHSTAWEFDYQGWLYLHFRLDGVSRELDREGREHMLGSHSFLLAASGTRELSMRQVLGDNWRTVGIACRPSFVRRELGIRDDALPKALQEFSGEAADTGFWYAGAMDSEMLEVSRHLLDPPVKGRTRNIYLRVKTLELLCLALESLDNPDLLEEPPVKLSQHDLNCLYRAREILDAAEELPSLETLAREVGLNRNKLSAGFKHVFGDPVAAYYRGMRLDRARERIIAGETSIGRIAGEAGYSDPGSFSKAFRQRFGVLPSAL